MEYLIIVQSIICLCGSVCTRLQAGQLYCHEFGTIWWEDSDGWSSVLTAATYRRRLRYIAAVRTLLYFLLVRSVRSYRYALVSVTGHCR